MLKKNFSYGVVRNVLKDPKTAWKQNTDLTVFCLLKFQRNYFELRLH